jgi:hypothetical protein
MTTTFRIGRGGLAFIADIDTTLARNSLAGRLEAELSARYFAAALNRRIVAGN